MQTETLASIDAEQAVLGSIVIDPDAIFDVMHELKPQDFSTGIHKHIFDAAVILADASEPVDVMTLSNVLERKGIAEYKKQPIFSYLIDLTNIVPTALNIKSYASQVKHDSVRRKLVDAAGQINTIARKNDVSTEQMLASAESTIEGISGGTRAKLATAKDAAVEFLEELENDKPVGIKTGLADLDNCIGGLEKGNGYWICAAEKMGKTSLANSISLHNAMAGRVVLRISAEIGEETTHEARHQRIDWYQYPKAKTERPNATRDGISNGNGGKSIRNKNDY